MVLPLTPGNQMQRFFGRTYRVEIIIRIGLFWMLNGCTRGCMPRLSTHPPTYHTALRLLHVGLSWLDRTHQPAREFRDALRGGLCAKTGDGAVRALQLKLKDSKVKRTSVVTSVSKATAAR